MKYTTPLDFNDLLNILGHGRPGDHTSINFQRGGAEGQFRTVVVESKQAARRAETIGDPGRVKPVDVWFGVNPVDQPAKPGSRGTEAEVRGLAALYVDLDVKPGGLPDGDSVNRVAAALAEALGTVPAAIVESGSVGGRHLYWPISDNIEGAEAKALLRRFGRLAAHFAYDREGGQVDSVFDLARVLRVPGSWNWKTGEPRPVKGWEIEGWQPLTVEEITAVLDRYDIPEGGSVTISGGPALSDAAGWSFADPEDGSCAYVTSMLGAWPTDPPMGGQRHRTVTAKATRLAAFWRAGCITEADFDRGRNILADWLHQRRNATATEVDDAIGWGVQTIAAKSDAELASELGHDPEHPYGREGGDSLDFSGRQRFTVLDGGNEGGDAPVLEDDSVSTSPYRDAVRARHQQQREEIEASMDVVDDEHTRREDLDDDGDVLTFTPAPVSPSSPESPDEPIVLEPEDEDEDYVGFRGEISSHARRMHRKLGPLLGQTRTDPILKAIVEQTVFSDARDFAKRQAEIAEHSNRSMDQFVDGAAFLLEGDDDDTPVWGSADGEDILHAPGEALLIAAGQGLGKTTIGQQLALGRAGLAGFGSLLGFPIAPGKGKVLYLAMDRPKQARRSLKRMVRAEDRSMLAERLVVWPGPPPSDLAANVEMLLQLCQKAEADTVIVDSLKDAALRLSEDATGAGWNRARQLALRAGIEVIELHHLRKNGTAGAGEPITSIDDLYGSTWITSGAGSVLLLSGKPGNAFVTMRHLKQPAGEVGPLRLYHDHGRGRTVVADGEVDLLAIVKESNNGVTAKEAAIILRGPEGDETDPDRNEIEKARRHLTRLVRRGLIEEIKGDKTAEHDRLKTSRWVDAQMELVFNKGHHDGHHAEVGEKPTFEAITEAPAPSRKDDPGASREASRASRGHQASRKSPLLNGGDACDGIQKTEKQTDFWDLDLMVPDDDGEEQEDPGPTVAPIEWLPAAGRPETTLELPANSPRTMATEETYPVGGNPAWHIRTLVDPNDPPIVRTCEGCGDRLKRFGTARVLRDCPNCYPDTFDDKDTQR